VKLYKEMKMQVTMRNLEWRRNNNLIEPLYQYYQKFFYF